MASKRSPYAGDICDSSSDHPKQTRIALGDCRNNEEVLINRVCLLRTYFHCWRREKAEAERYGILRSISTNKLPLTRAREVKCRRLLNLLQMASSVFHRCRASSVMAG